MSIITAVAALLAGLGNVGAVLAAGGTVTLATFLVPAGIAAVGGFILSRLTPSVDPQGFDVIGASARTVRGSVLPLRWIVGRARVSGALVWLHESGRNLDLIYVLGAGPLDAIEEIWINGQPLGINFEGDFNSGAEGRPTQSRYGNRSGQPLFRAYLSGDPDMISGSPAVVDQFSRASPRPWTSAHQLRGLAWVHVSLHQPDYGTNVNNRVWSQVPELHFLVRGLKFTHPRNPTTPAWTQNAAAIRYWWLRERRGIPADQIDDAHYASAFDACDEFLRLDGLDDFTDDYLPNFHRYSINGVIVAGDRVEAVEANMDAAWAGNVVEFDGIHRFLPGVDRPVSAIIGVDDIIESPTFRPAPEHHERVNQLSARVSQSIYHDFTEYSLAPIDDEPAQERDGELLPADLGTFTYVNDPVQGFSILAKQLRRERAVAQIDLVVRPGDAFENVTLAPGDVVALTLPEWELTNARYLVLASEVEDNWRVRLSLIVHPDGIYADTLQLPPIGSRSFVPTDAPDNVPVLATLQLSIAYRDPTSSRSISEEPPGEAVIITWSWDSISHADGYEYRFQRLDENADDSPWIGTTARSVTRAAYTRDGDFTDDQTGAWRFEARGRSSAFAIAPAATDDFSVVGHVGTPFLSASHTTVYHGEISGEDEYTHTIRVFAQGNSIAPGTHIEFRSWSGTSLPSYPSISYNFTRRSFGGGEVQIYSNSVRLRGGGSSINPLTSPRWLYRAVDTTQTPEIFSWLRTAMPT